MSTKIGEFFKIDDDTNGIVMDLPHGLRLAITQMEEGQRNQCFLPIRNKERAIAIIKLLDADEPIEAPPKEPRHERD